jgi:hypothetical protein
VKLRAPPPSKSLPGLDHGGRIPAAGRVGRAPLARLVAAFAGALLAILAITDELPATEASPPSSADNAHQRQKAPIKLAVFDFEVEDFSAAAGVAGENPTVTEQLKVATSEARALLAQSGRYQIVDMSTADAEAVKAHTLRNCNGCDAGIAMRLGAEQSLVGVVTKISMTEYNVTFQIRDARTGNIISNVQTGLRMGADYSWNRGAAWLIKNRLSAAREGAATDSGGR